MFICWLEKISPFTRCVCVCVCCVMPWPHTIAKCNMHSPHRTLCGCAQLHIAATPHTFRCNASIVFIYIFAIGIKAHLPSTTATTTAYIQNEPTEKIEWKKIKMNWSEKWDEFMESCMIMNLLLPTSIPRFVWSYRFKYSMHERYLFAYPLFRCASNEKPHPFNWEQ